MNVKLIFDKFFNGEKNFMTPDVYGYTKKKFGDEYLVIEKSRGLGFEHEDIFGCSILVHNPVTMETQHIELSQMFYSNKELDKYIKSITREMFENAERFGEIKRC